MALRHRRALPPASRRHAGLVRVPLRLPKPIGPLRNRVGRARAHATRRNDRPCHVVCFFYRPHLLPWTFQPRFIEFLLKQDRSNPLQSCASPCSSCVTRPQIRTRFHRGKLTREDPHFVRRDRAYILYSLRLYLQFNAGSRRMEVFHSKYVRPRKSPSGRSIFSPDL